MNQSCMDSLMETLTNIVIGLVIASTTNFFIIPHIMGVPLSGHQNAMISAAFTVVSLVRQFTLRRLFNGRSVWSAIKDKFNAHQVPHHEGAGLLDAGARAGAAGLADVRLGADVPSRHRKRSYHFWGIRK